MSDDILWESLSTIAQSDGAMRRAYDLALAALSHRYVVDARLERKLASIIFEIYIERISEIDSQSLARASIDRWFQLCGPPIHMSGSQPQRDPQ